jgi:DNA polymerase IV
MSDTRAILHVDMDAFFASVEQHDNPELRGLPVIVGGAGSRGVVAAASYEVRRFGVRSAMPTREALQRCPEAICVRPRMQRYREVSNQVFAIFQDFTPQVEGLSLDEAFLDVTASRSLLGAPELIARNIKNLIRERTGVTASVGVASNKLLAKLASDMQKPDGLTVISPEDVAGLLDPLPVGRLSGIGTRTVERLAAHGIHSFHDLRTASDAVLTPLFGRYVRRIRERAAGIDDRPVVADWQEKQVSAEETFDTDLRRREQMVAALAHLTDRACTRLRAKSLLAAQVTVKIRRRDFTTFTRQRSFSPPTQDTRYVQGIAIKLLDEWLSTQPRAAVRLLGVGVGSLQSSQQLDLFAAGARDEQRRVVPTLDAAVDGIRARFGTKALTRGSNLARPEPKQDGFTEVRRK